MSPITIALLYARRGPPRTTARLGRSPMMSELLRCERTALPRRLRMTTALLHGELKMIALPRRPRMTSELLGR
jgi:hypothetical protein